MEQSGFYFIELAELVKGQPFAGMVAGSFVDMNGRDVELAAADIAEFAANTNALIAGYKERGMPGLPIDARRHDKGDAAGWIVLAEAGELPNGTPAVRITAEWTALGVELISGRIMTNFSPTIDLGGKAIRGGSLTNWPASLDERGVPLFAAVELAQGIHAYIAPRQGVLPIDRSEGKMTIELTNEQLEEMVTARVTAQLAELNQQLPAQLAEALGVKADAQIANIAELAEIIKAQEQRRWQNALAEMQRQNEYTELAASLTGGVADAPRGIPAQADELRDHLLKLTPEEATFWIDLLGNIQRAGLTEFAEAGHGKRVSVKRAVPEYAVRSLKAALAAGTDAEMFFSVAGLGSAAEYDLSPYEEK